jgi:hypothetical protein
LVKPTFYSVVNRSAEGDGLPRGNNYGEASDLQINKKCKQINEKHNNLAIVIFDIISKYVTST